MCEVVRLALPTSPATIIISIDSGPGFATIPPSLGARANGALQSWPRRNGGMDTSPSTAPDGDMPATIAIASATIQHLLTGFRKLLTRAERLSARRQSGMAICMSNIWVTKRQRPIEQAGRVKQLTVLAFLYILLSYAAPIFGMGLELFGQENVAWWVCLPVTASLAGGICGRLPSWEGVALADVII